MPLSSLLIPVPILFCRERRTAPVHRLRGHKVFNRRPSLQSKIDDLRKISAQQKAYCCKDEPLQGSLKLQQRLLQYYYPRSLLRIRFRPVLLLHQFVRRRHPQSSRMSCLLHSYASIARFRLHVFASLPLYIYIYIYMVFWSSFSLRALLMTG